MKGAGAGTRSKTPASTADHSTWPHKACVPSLRGGCSRRGQRPVGFSVMHVDAESAQLRFPCWADPGEIMRNLLRFVVFAFAFGISTAHATCTEPSGAYVGSGAGLAYN